MNTYLRITLTMAIAMSLFSMATARADYRNYNYKAWANSGHHRSSQTMRQSRPAYRNAEPVIVTTQSAPAAVAQAPTEERRFSHEPAQQAPSDATHQKSVQENSAPAATKQPTKSGRSYSYEPAIENNRAPRTARTYSAPRSHSRSNTPKYLLPKTDPNKYRN